MLSVVRQMPKMLSFIIPNDVMRIVILLIVVILYASMLSIIMLSLILLSVVLLRVVAPCWGLAFILLRGECVGETPINSRKTDNIS